MSLSRRRFLVVGTAAVGSAAALAAACAPSAPPATPTATTSPTLAPTAAPTTAPTVAPTVVSTLKIGILVPYNESSIGVDIGLNQKRAADLYLKQHGGKLGGKPVNLVYSAESIEPNINKVKIHTLTDTEKVGLLMGGASNESALLMRDAAEAAKLVYVATHATANALSRESRSQYVFRTSATAAQVNTPLGEWAARNGQSECFVAYVDDSFGTEAADAFIAGLEKASGSATGRGAFPNGGDWAKAVSQVMAQPAKNVFAAFQTDDAEGFIGEWHKQGLAQSGYKLFGPGALTDESVITAVQEAADGIVTSYFWSPDLDNPDNTALVKAFPQEYTDDDTGLPVPLNGYAVEMWDAMHTLDVVLAQGLDVSALEAVSFTSPRGQFAFDRAAHSPIQDIYIRQVKSVGGKWVNTVVEKVPHVAPL